jgi:hypothetical protein
LEAAVALDRGERLPGYDEPWVLTEGQALAELDRGARRRVAAVREAIGDLEGAMGAARQPRDRDVHAASPWVAAASGDHSKEATVRETLFRRPELA